MVYLKVILFLSMMVSLFAMDIKTIKSYEADFKQFIIKDSNNKIEYSGRVYIEKPSNILWQYKSPIIKNVFVNKNYVVIDEPELEQAIYSSLEKEMNFIEIFEKAKKIDDKNYIASINSKDYNLIVENGVITKINYKDEIDNTIEIFFENIKIDTLNNSKIFKFELPEHYDIIRK